MLTDPQRDYARTVVRTLQIIVGAMAAGVIAFLGVVIFLVSKNAQAPNIGEPMITYVSVLMAVATIIAWIIVPGVISSQMRKSLVDGRSANWSLCKNLPNSAELGDVVPLAMIYQTRVIVAVALLEGAAFLATIAYMLEHQSIALYNAIVLLCLILTQIPNLSRLESWIESELAVVAQMRQMR